MASVRIYQMSEWFSFLFSILCCNYEFLVIFKAETGDVYPDHNCSENVRFGSHAATQCWGNCFEADIVLCQ